MSGYFDSNATTPLHPAAREAWLAAADRFWHNPSGLYREGAAARRELEDAREQAAEWLGCGAEEVVFLSGATEANNAVMRHFAPVSGSGVWSAADGADRADGAAFMAAVSGLEHPSVAEPAAHGFGAGLRRIPVTGKGIADLEALREILAGDRPALVSLMAANNETGVIQPWAEALELCRKQGAAFHCDAAQWIGKMPSAGLGECDFVTGSAHKFGGPKGVGFLKVPAAGRPLRWLRGGPQEERRRAGTENLPAVAAMMAAWAVRERELREPGRRSRPLPGGENPELLSEFQAPSGFQASSGFPLRAGALPWSPDPARLAARRNFEKRILELLPGAGIIAERGPRLWNTVLLTVPPPGNVKWLVRLGGLGFQVSTGSACSQGGGASEVLRAMGLPEEKLGQVLRVSGGWETRAEDWMALAGAFAEVASGISRRPGAGTAVMSLNPGARGLSGS